MGLFLFDFVNGSDRGMDKEGEGRWIRYKLRREIFLDTNGGKRKTSRR